MSVIITKGKLSKTEIELLSQESKKSLHIGYLAPSVWQQFHQVYIARVRSLVGVCVVIPTKHYLKIGPILVLENYQGKHIGSKLIEAVVKENKDNNLYAGSSNPRVIHLLTKHGFTEYSYWQIPLEIKLYLLSYVWQRGNITYLLDSLKKISKARRGKYRYFIK